MKAYLVTSSFYDYHEGGTSILSLHSTYETALVAAHESMVQDGFTGPEISQEPSGQNWRWERKDRTDVWSVDIFEMDLV
jgi:hypothetical protein